MGLNFSTESWAIILEVISIEAVSESTEVD